jgi:Fe-S-cluster containining protein
MEPDNFFNAICIRCQECCKWMTFTLDGGRQRDQLIEYYEKHGCRVVTEEKIGWSKVQVMIPYQCPNLTEKGCAIYTQRPQFCREYDGRNDPLLRDVCKLPKM